MKSSQFLAVRLAECGLLVCAAVVAGQQPSEALSKPSGKPVPVKIEKQVMTFPESVVTEQWPHTPKIANPPENLKLLNPGQCVRVGVIAIGDDRDAYLGKSQLSLRFEFAGKVQSNAPQALAATKQMKPEGSDMINAALNYAGVPLPGVSSASIGASAASWCVPDDAQDGMVTIDSELETPKGLKKLQTVTIPVESLETGSKRAFKSGEEFEQFTMQYHYQPEPARLFPFLQYFGADEKFRNQTGALETSAAFIGSALRADPAAAKDFTTRVASQTGFTRAFGLLILLNAGFDIDQVLKTMSDDDRKRFANHPVLPDPFDFSHVEDIGTRLDMLWSIFLANGQLAPVRQIVSALAWHSDWEDFDKARQSANPPKEWTPAIGRAVGYGAAGWALGSFQRTDPLAADYIEDLISAPDTPDVVKTELKGLATNPAFRWQDKK